MTTPDRLAFLTKVSVIVPLPSRLNVISTTVFPPELNIILPEWNAE